MATGIYSNISEGSYVNRPNRGPLIDIDVVSRELLLLLSCEKHTVSIHAQQVTWGTLAEDYESMDGKHVWRARTVLETSNYDYL